ncbi:MAG: fibrobacter succinogenes major paralogous domain-containing protein [Candidatus Delongbacteria bacterium]|nr:fibrobacter succinogenes major paralogous domain-containing protein [Candidatus Delongbacteria bacterium]MCG2760233.1 fibrobacter succinogenes major paralogous domain-containing protein [Candidatus Delongbacteria bacterium]
MSNISFLTRLFFLTAIILTAIFMISCSSDSNSTVDPFVDHTGEIGTVTDIDGNVYPTIGIGGQIWMASNLKVTHYRNEEMVPNLTDNAEWSATTSGAYCSYNNDPANSVVYGHLYNWYAVIDSRNIAPEGWHVPTESEWDKLINWLGGENSAGSRLKEAGTTHWSLSNSDATNESEFTALPGGMKFSSYYMNLNTQCYFRTRSYWDLVGTIVPVNYSLHSDSLSVFSYSLQYKEMGMSVRCVKN